MANTAPVVQYAGSKKKKPAKLPTIFKKTKNPTNTASTLLDG